MSDSVEISAPCSNDGHSFDAIDKRAESIASALLTRLSDSTSAQIPTLDSLAESLNLSSGRLQHIIKQETGVPFSRHVKILRLQRARKLLQETCWTVKQVMIEVGLSDHSHFAKDYKKQFGESPTQTRCAALATRDKLVPCLPQQNTCTGSTKLVLNQYTTQEGIRAESRLHDSMPGTESQGVDSSYREEPQA